MSDGLIIACVVGLILIPIVSLPVLIAFKRGHKNSAAILIVSLLVALFALNQVASLVTVALNMQNDRYATPSEGTREVVKAIGRPVEFIGLFIWVVALVWAVLAGQEDRRYGRRRTSEPDDVPNPFNVAPPAPVLAVPASMTYTCPHCRRLASVPASMFGFTVMCAGCRGQFTATPPTF